MQTTTKPPFQDPPPIIPAPNRCRLTGGRFLLGPGTCRLMACAMASDTTRFLQRDMHVRLGWVLK